MYKTKEVFPTLIDWVRFDSDMVRDGVRAT